MTFTTPKQNVLEEAVNAGIEAARFEYLDPEFAFAPISSRGRTKRYWVDANGNPVHTKRKASKEFVSTDVQFIALDGEGYTDDNGDHWYTLLAASTGERIANPAGLRTKQCLEFLLMLGRDYPGATFVSFYFSYDTNMILGNLHPMAIKPLCSTGKTQLKYPDDRERRIRIEYIPTKFLKLTDCLFTSEEQADGSIRFGYKTIRSITVYDTFGFFQQSFLGACKEYNVGTDDEIDILTRMKQSRSFFGSGNKEIEAYNDLELRLLVELMNKVKSGLDKCEIGLRSWHGAGAIAGEIYRKHNVKEHIYRPSFGSDIESAVYHAYFGGRIQAVRLGTFSKVWSHDIVSCYPSTIREIPSLKGCTPVISETTRSECSPELYGLEGIIPILYRIKWEGCYTPITPFPFRDKDGSIYYPANGEGWYWHSEVQAAYITGFPFEITEKIVFNYGSSPFGFVGKLFDDRKRFKAAGDHTQLILKLGLNSLYGKMAQSQFNVSIPAYQSYIYAGLVTAHARSRLLTAAMEHPNDVIAFATDGLWSTSRHDVKEGKSLGDWEVDEYKSFFILKPGFYEATDEEGMVRTKVRGFRSSEVQWKELKEEWEKNGIEGICDFPTTQFYGMKACGEDMHNWRKWINGTKSVHFRPNYGTYEYETNGNIRINPEHSEGMSAPYKQDAIAEVDLLDDIEELVE